MTAQLWKSIFYAHKNSRLSLTLRAKMDQSQARRETAAEAARTRQWREVGLGAQILKDLGVRSIRLLSSSQHTYVGLGGFGIEITATEGLEG